ncbi:MAG TPA: hypothetical protein VEU08_04510 [Vicinamibacterales bacterium]|nr:hypothetical protein [Vicinamibacterales bacterium]
MNRLMIGIAGAALAAGIVHGQEPRTSTVFVRTPLESKTVKGAPYSAEFSNDFVQTLADGNRIVHHSTGRVYRDAEGRVRREEDHPNGAPSVSITDPVAGVSYSLNSETHIASKTPAFAGAVIMNKLEELKTTIQVRTGDGWEAGAAGTVEPKTFFYMRSNDEEKHSAETLPSRVIEGVLADGKRTTTTIPAGAIGNERELTIVVEEWTSPDLQVLVLTQHKDPRSGDSTYRLTNVNRAEPAASLFEVPSDYTIRDTGIRRFDRQ